MTASRFSGRQELYGSLGIAFAAATWGAYWIPLRHIDGLGLHSTWATFSTVFLATIVLLPLQAVRWRRLVRGGWALWLPGLIGGTAFILYSNAYAYTTILNVQFLFYLSPVWSTLLARAFLDEPITGVRIFSILVAFIGLAVMLGGGGQWPIPRTTGDWMTLGSGALWSITTVILRKYQGPKASQLASDRAAPGAIENTFLFFAGGMIGASVLPFLLLDDPIGTLPSVERFEMFWPWLVGMALLWWVPTQFMLMWGVPRVSPGRVGLLLMTEAVFGSITAALFSDEPFGWRQIVGGGLILFGAVADSIAEMRRGVADKRNSTNQSWPNRTDGHDVSLGRLQP